MKMTIDEASSSAIIVKDAILARSGIYVYSHDEMVRRGYKPEITKAFYKEYRPASVLVAAKDKFKYAILTKEHPRSITTDNVQQVIEGVVGSNIEVVVLDNDEIALKGELAFYTTDGVDYYNSGAKETSAQYHSKVIPVSGKDYDFVLEEIQNVQGLALTRQGRGGSSVAVLDSLLSAAQAEKNIEGDKNMRNINSLLSLLGIGKAPQDELSSLVIDSLTGYEALSDAEKKTRKDKVDALINPLPESDKKKILIGTVADCFSYPKEVLEKSEVVSNGLKHLYKQCVSTEAAALQATFDSIKEKEDETKDAEEEEKKKKEKETKDAEDKKKKDDEEAEAKKKETKDAEKETKDSISLEATIAKIVAQVTDSLASKIDEAVKKQLGTNVGSEEDTKDSILPSFGNPNIKDNSFLLNKIFS